jgi:hypothetical protein
MGRMFYGNQDWFESINNYWPSSIQESRNFKIKIAMAEMNIAAPALTPFENGNNFRSIVSNPAHTTARPIKNSALILVYNLDTPGNDYCLRNFFT